MSTSLPPANVVSDAYSVTKGEGGLLSPKEAGPCMMTLRKGDHCEGVHRGEEEDVGTPGGEEGGVATPGGRQGWIVTPDCRRPIASSFSPHELRAEFNQLRRYVGGLLQARIGCSKLLDQIAMQQRSLQYLEGELLLTSKGRGLSEQAGMALPTEGSHTRKELWHRQERADHIGPGCSVEVLDGRNPSARGPRPEWSSLDEQARPHQ